MGRRVHSAQASTQKKKKVTKIKPNAKKQNVFDEGVSLLREGFTNHFQNSREWILTCPRYKESFSEAEGNAELSKTLDILCGIFGLIAVLQQCTKQFSLAMLNQTILDLIHTNYEDVGIVYDLFVKNITNVEIAIMFTEQICFMKIVNAFFLLNKVMESANL